MICTSVPSCLLTSKPLPLSFCWYLKTSGCCWHISAIWRAYPAPSYESRLMDWRPGTLCSPLGLWLLLHRTPHVPSTRHLLHVGQHAEGPSRLHSLQVYLEQWVATIATEDSLCDAMVCAYRANAIRALMVGKAKSTNRFHSLILIDSQVPTSVEISSSKCGF